MGVFGFVINLASYLRTFARLSLLFVLFHTVSKVELNEFFLLLSSPFLLVSQLSMWGLVRRHIRKVCRRCEKERRGFDNVALAVFLNKEQKLE